MNNKKTLKEATSLVNYWKKELNKYEIKDLLKRSNTDSWSLGQVYVHLINATLNFHLGQIDICLKTNENNKKKKNIKGVITYHILNQFPPIQIKVPPSEAYTPLQPKSKEEIEDGLELILEKMNAILGLFTKEAKDGKTEHPGFSYLDASEWFRLIPLHLKHHKRQKVRIENFLKNGE